MIEYKGDNLEIHETEEGIEFSRRYCWADLPHDEMLRMVAGGSIDGIYTFRGSVYMVINRSWRLVKISSNAAGGMKIETMHMTGDDISCASNALARLSQEKNP